VISSNNTLVIHDLQYNDSNYKFSSRISIDIDAGMSRKNHVYGLQQVTTLDINGIPDFIKKPPNTFDVNEGSNLQLAIVMDGNPRPSADFSWPHLAGSSPMNALSVQMRPFEYWSTYGLGNIDARYCGRMLQTTIRNKNGENTMSTLVTVLLKLDHLLHLKARKIADSGCVEVRWNKAESGACCVKYKVEFEDASGNILHTGAGCNIGKMEICDLIVYASVFNVQLTVSFKTTSKTVIKRVSGTQISTQAPTKAISFKTTSKTVVKRVSGTQISTPAPTKANLNILLIVGISCSIAALRIIFYWIHWCMQLQTTTALISIRNTYSSANDVHLDIHTP